MSSNDNRVFGLDVLRAFAVLFVVYGHGYYLVEWAVPDKLYNLPVFDGVTMFFVLSGFLIGRILLRTVSHDQFDAGMLLTFWIRRWFRTLPNYLLVLSFVAISSVLLGKAYDGRLGLYFLFSQNLASPHPQFFPEAWSLTIEEWFYLTMPIPLYLAARCKHLDRTRLMPFYIALVIVVVTVFRWYRANYFDFELREEWDLNLRKQVVTRMDSLMFGVFGAYLSLYKQSLWTRYGGRCMALGLLLMLADKTLKDLLSYSPFYMNYLTFSVSSLAVLLLLPKLSQWKRARGPLATAITFVSLTSYSMYLLNLTPVQHIMLPQVMKALGVACGPCGDNTVLRYLLYWLLTIVCSYFLYRFYELPMTGLRDKWPVHHAKVVTAFKFADKLRKKVGKA